MKTNMIIVLLIVAVLVIGGAVYFFIQQSKPVTAPQGGNNIEISGFAFSPATMTISVGDTVTWTNMDIMSHTVTSDSGTELGSSSFGKGGTYSHTFSTPGTFAYHCSIHSSMKGTVIVS